MVGFSVAQWGQVKADIYNERSCDCTEIIGKCSGTITDIREEKVTAKKTTSILFNIRSDHQQCSKVEYYIDNTPYQSVFYGGLTSESTFGINKNVKVEYNSCQVCKMRSDKKKISDDEIDALMDKAQKEGDKRINQANYEARTAINKSNQVYQDAYSSLGDLTHSMQQTSQAINSRSSVRSNAKFGNSYSSYAGNSKTEAVRKLLTAMVNKNSSGSDYSQASIGGGFSNSNSNYNIPKLGQDIISKVSCSGDTSILGSILKPYQDPMLIGYRDAYLNSSAAAILAEAKKNGSKEAALQHFQQERIDADQQAAGAADSSTQTWGGPGEDLASLLNSDRLPLGISCGPSIPYQQICVSVAHRWSSLVAQLSMEIVKKCW